MSTNPTVQTGAVREDLSEALELGRGIVDAIERLATARPPPPSSRVLPFDPARLEVHCGRFGLDADIVDQLVRDAPAGGQLAFLSDIERAVGANAYMVAFIREAWARGATSMPDPRAVPDAALSLVEALHYAWVIHWLTRTLSLDPTGDWLDRVDQQIRRRMEGLDWQRDAGVFERLKVRSIRSLDYWATAKRDRHYADRAMRWRVIINVLEAMGRDRGLGNHDNAAAGLVLLENPFGWTAIEGLGNGPNRVDELGRRVATAPEPKLWADLYQAWNMAFVWQYPAAPLHWAKLLCPVVADYRESPGLYLYHRPLSLFLHLRYAMIRHYEGAAEGQVDWRDPALARLYGEVNRTSAQAYAARVDTPALRGHRRRVRLLWTLVRSMVRPGRYPHSGY